MSNASCAPPDASATQMICQFEQADTRNWDGRANADRSVRVAGQARVGNPDYRAKLFMPQVQGSTARAFLTMAENDTGQAPPNGWWDVEHTFPDPGGEIQTVEIWCDLETMLAQVPVRRS